MLFRSRGKFPYLSVRRYLLHFREEVNTLRCPRQNVPEKMQLYCEQEIEEYWIVDWRKKTVEIYELDYEGEIPKYYLLKTVTEENKDELQLLHFPKIKITFDELFEEID